MGNALANLLASGALRDPQLAPAITLGSLFHVALVEPWQLQLQRCAEPCAQIVVLLQSGAQLESAASSNRP